MGRTKARKSGRRTRRTPDRNEVLGLFYRREGPLLYGWIAFMKHPPNGNTPRKPYASSSPFIISETTGNEEVVCGSVVSLIQEVRRLNTEIGKQLGELRSGFSHIQPTTVEQGYRMSKVVTLPESLSAKDDRTYAEFKKRLVGTLVLLSTQARNLFDIFPPLLRDSRISLLDYERNAAGTVALRDLLVAFIHHRYLFFDGEYVSDLFPGDPRKSPIKRTFMGYKFNWIEYVQAIERAALEVKMKHLTGLLRGRLKRLTLKSPYDEIIFLVQNLESFGRLLGKKVGDNRYRGILALLFDDQRDQHIESVEPRLGGDTHIDYSVVFQAPKFKIHEYLSEKMFDVSVNCRWEVQAGSDRRSVHVDKDFKTLKRKVKYEQLFDLVNQAFGEDALVS